MEHSISHANTVRIFRKRSLFLCFEKGGPENASMMYSCALSDRNLNTIILNLL